RLPADAVGVSSAVVGGGWSRPGWILNVQVERGSARTDVEAHVAAIATSIEAKTQAFIERGIPGTGTATDTVTIVWRPTAEPPVRFCGPGAPFGAALARATRDAVAAAMPLVGAVGR
ncbi:MAG: adenosylcobinamide amidohydrolase, partial [Actinomycetota bacterium]